MGALDNAALWAKIRTCRTKVVLPPPEPAATIRRMGKPPNSATSAGVMRGVSRKKRGARVAEGGGVGAAFRSRSGTTEPSSSSL